jgi:chromosome segregation ATPase
VSPTPTYEPPPPRSGLMTALVAGALIVLVGANIYLYVQIDHLRTDTTANLAKMRESIMSELGSVRDASSVNTASQSQRIENLKAELANAQSQARSLSSEAKAEAVARAEQLTKQLQAEQAKVQQQVSTEISGVRQSAETANAKVADVSTDVGTVKTNLASTNAELQKTIADLKSAKGDLNVQSGLIATNGNELAALRRLGERNYFEFRVAKPKKKEFTKIGSSDIQIQLKKTDPKKNKYTIDVMADDKVIEKPDKGINEPVQFLTAKSKQLYELVVNSVQKDMIVGYLSVPKDLAAR